MQIFIEITMSIYKFFIILLPLIQIVSSLSKVVCRSLALKWYGMFAAKTIAGTEFLYYVIFNDIHPDLASVQNYRSTNGYKDIRI